MDIENRLYLATAIMTTLSDSDSIDSQVQKALPKGSKSKHPKGSVRNRQVQTHHYTHKEVNKHEELVEKTRQSIKTAGFKFFKKPKDFLHFGNPIEIYKHPSEEKHFLHFSHGKDSNGDYRIQVAHHRPQKEHKRKTKNRG